VTRHGVFDPAQTGQRMLARLREVPSPRPVSPLKKPAKPQFGLDSFLEKAGLRRRTLSLPRHGVAYSQGSAATSVLYIQRGGMKLSVTSALGKEAVVAMLGPGDFFGEGCLLPGQPLRLSSATALVPTELVRVSKSEMARLLDEQHEFSSKFIRHILGRNVRIEEDLIDQLFNSSEKRLARTLLLLARYGTEEAPPGDLPKLSQETLAEMIGSTRSRVNFFMTKFRKLGYIEYNGHLKINASLLSVVLHD
jgi:CRP/FNR family cyclic AMP-dependent transcriptional regulator